MLLGTDVPLEKHEEGVRLYHLQQAAKDAPVGGVSVRKPRHFIAYHMIDSRTLQIVRILYDAMNLESHLP